jgi:hypothetical protein
MPHNLTPTATWTTPAAVPADGDADAQATFDPAFQMVVNRLELLKQVALDDVTTWTTWPRVGLGIRLDLASVAYKPGDWNLLGTSPGTLPTVLALETPASGLARVAAFPLNDVVRNGMVIGGFSVKVKPGTARSPSNRMTVALVGVDASGTATVFGGTWVDDGTTSVQYITNSIAIGHTIDKTTYEYTLQVLSGNGGIQDDLFNGSLDISDPGPRNI